MATVADEGAGECSNHRDEQWGENTYRVGRVERKAPAASSGNRRGRGRPRDGRKRKSRQLIGDEYTENEAKREPDDH